MIVADVPPASCSTQSSTRQLRQMETGRELLVDPLPADVKAEISDLFVSAQKEEQSPEVKALVKKLLAASSVEPDLASEARTGLKSLGAN